MIILFSIIKTTLSRGFIQHLRDAIFYVFTSTAFASHLLTWHYFHYLLYLVLLRDYSFSSLLHFHYYFFTFSLCIHCPPSSIILFCCFSLLCPCLFYLRFPCLEFLLSMARILPSSLFVFCILYLLLFLFLFFHLACTFFHHRPLSWSLHLLLSSFFFFFLYPLKHFLVGVCTMSNKITYDTRLTNLINAPMS
jgi:hypothetical protein